MTHSGTKLLTGQLRRPHTCLVLGACGAGMSAAIEILLDLGHTVLGFDDSLPHPHLERSAASAEGAFRIVNDGVDLSEVDLCIASPAIRADHPWRQAVSRAGISVLSLPELIGQVFAAKKQICVAGTHGKSTTAAMIAWVLEQTGAAPSFFVGAKIPVGGAFSGIDSRIPSSPATGHWRRGSSGCSGRMTSSGWAVVESCEYAYSFLNFDPQIAVLTGVERDHFDCFPDTQAEDAAFLQFLQRSRNNASLIGWSECHRSRGLIHSASGQNRQVLTVGAMGDESPDADFRISNVQLTKFRSHCELRHAGQSHHFTLPVPGVHNLRNAVQAAAAAHAAGVPLADACRALGTFTGLQRRFESRGRYRGIELVDDYAHHPTAIGHALQAARQRFPGRRLITVLEPHQLSRLRSLFDRFVDALIPADEILVLPVFAAREDATLLECCRVSGDLVRSINQRGGRSFLFANLDQIVARIDHSAKPNDVLLTLGAGRTNLIHDEFHRRLQRHSVA